MQATCDGSRRHKVPARQAAEENVGNNKTTMPRAAGVARIELGVLGSGTTCRLSVQTNRRRLPFASTKCAKSQAQRRESALPDTEMNLTLWWNELNVLPVLAATFLHTDCR